jgi:biotin transport system substrate-specific component
MTTPTFSLSLTHDRRSALWAAPGFVLALALASQLAVPIPGTPVPITLQPLVIVLTGLTLGPVVGAGAMIAYLVLGALGLPVFAPVGAPGIARFFGPTGGYLLAYPAAAYVAGALSQHMPSLLGRWMAACAGIAVLFVGGVGQLTILTGSFGRAVALGVTPFAVLDLVKAFFAAALTRPHARPNPD